MKFDLIVAKTHPAEYMLHKYWARKPHNVLSYYIQELVPENGLVVDPFCGSGVSLKEAQKLGLDAIGFDVNPIAILISKVTINPPSSEEFASEVGPMLRQLEEKTSRYFSCNGKNIKYVKHKIVVECICGNYCTKDEANGIGRTITCPKCNEKLRFNLENLKTTKISELILEGNEIIKDKSEIDIQEKYSNQNIFENDTSPYDYYFTENRRILSFEGMKTSSLFTPRNFSILCQLADEIEKIKSTTVRDAAKLLLTASVAQCSRLIPVRNNLSTGGPAWSVPGFWVPAEHLETNPVQHLNARYKKFIKGLKQLNKSKNNSDILIKKIPAEEGLDYLINKEKYADLIFFDPPYGDSVPYLEFSSIWNSFLKDFPDLSDDMSVSDRISKNDSWKNYYDSMENSIKKISDTLKPAGKLLITFNNNDLKAWEALIGGLQRNRLKCDFVTYQIPPVISSKAQFSIKGSYISDIYSIYSKDRDYSVTKSLQPVSDALIKAASARNGKINNNFAQRICMIEWMKNNISVDLLLKKDLLIESLFNQTEEALILRQEYFIETIDIREKSISLAKNIIEKGPIEWKELYIQIAQELIDYGLPEPSEIRSYLEKDVIFNKKLAISMVHRELHQDYEQLRLEF